MDNSGKPNRWECRRLERWQGFSAQWVGLDPVLERAGSEPWSGQGADKYSSMTIRLFSLSFAGLQPGGDAWTTCEPIQEP